jgi:hypothetical protein
MTVVERSLFDDVAHALRGILPAGSEPAHVTYHRYGIKVWLGSDRPAREHYEGQVIGRQYCPGARVLAIEVGFHSEHPKETDNDEVIARMRRSEKKWRRALGDDAVVGPFLGRAEHWRRVSETWPDPDLGDPELVFQLAGRLNDYIQALEPYRT